MRTKSLCQVCHDGYGDEEHMFGRCCSVPMVEIPMEVWDKVKNNKDSINHAIKTVGIKLTKE